MPTALNFTVKIKQDAETLAKLAHLKENFAAHVQPAIDKVLRESEIVHYARVLVVDDRYLQVMTEFDGSREDYTEFFRTRLPDVFKAIFSLAEGVPEWDVLNNRETFFNVARDLNVRSLGASTRGDDKEGYLFSAFGETGVQEIKASLGSPVA